MWRIEPGSKWQMEPASIWQIELVLRDRCNQVQSGTVNLKLLLIIFNPPTNQRQVRNDRPTNKVTFRCSELELKKCGFEKITKIYYLFKNTMLVKLLLILKRSDKQKSNPNQIQFRIRTRKTSQLHRGKLITYWMDAKGIQWPGGPLRAIGQGCIFHQFDSLFFLNTNFPDNTFYALFSLPQNLQNQGV